MLSYLSRLLGVVRTVAGSVLIRRSVELLVLSGPNLAGVLVAVDLVFLVAIRLVLMGGGLRLIEVIPAVASVLVGL